MKRSFLLLIAFTIIFIGQSHAQEKQVVKKEIRKEVKLEEEKGVKTLTIRTSENGTESVEVYKGEEAEKKLTEFEAQHGEGSAIKEERTIEEVNGQRVVRVNKTVDGETIEEVKESDSQREQPVVKPEKTKTKEIQRIEIKRN
jgi:hypothetical protein